MSHGNRRLFRLIGLTGAAGSGKDSVAAALVDIGFVQYALASPIKRALNAIFGWSMANWDNREWKESEVEGLGFSPRRAAQTLGTEWGRALNDKLWLEICRITLAFYDAAKARGDKQEDGEGLPHYVGMVISDVRFENEAAFVREHGGEIWHIERPGIAPVAAHQSEAGVLMQQHDIKLYNTGTLDGLKTASKMIARGE